VRSVDGTSIAYECQGDGPAVILVGGGIVDRSENAPLAPELAEFVTVYNYDRRGRGSSGDAPAAVSGRSRPGRPQHAGARVEVAGLGPADESS
jgi:hypothetical protein